MLRDQELPSKFQTPPELVANEFARSLVKVVKSSEFPVAALNVRLFPLTVPTAVVEKLVADAAAIEAASKTREINLCIVDPLCLTVSFNETHQLFRSSGHGAIIKLRVKERKGERPSTSQNTLGFVWFVGYCMGWNGQKFGRASSLWREETRPG